MTYCEKKDKIVINNYDNKTEKFIRIPFGSFIAKINNKYEIVSNYPKIESIERQIAEHICLDLNDKNNIIINYKDFFCYILNRLMIR